MILVTGATGRVGFHLAEMLADAKLPTTAMVRVAARAEILPSPLRHVVASLDAPPPPEVLREFDRVFLLSPSHEEQVELEVQFIDAIVAAGHRPHIVKMAADGFQEPDCEVRFMRIHREIAVHLQATGLPVTYLAPNVYMESLLPAASSVRLTGTLEAPAAQASVGFVAARDVAAVAAHALTRDSEQDRIYVLTGPAALGYTDVAAQMSAVFARQIDYVDVPPARALEQMRADGVSAWEAEGMLELFEWIRGGGCDTVTREVREATGEDPRTLSYWLNDSRAVFIGPQTLPALPRF